MFKYIVVCFVSLGTGYLIGVSSDDIESISPAQVSHQQHTPSPPQPMPAPRSSQPAQCATVPSFDTTGTFPSWESALKVLLDDDTKGLDLFRAYIGVALLPEEEQVAFIKHLSGLPLSQKNLELQATAAFLLASEHPGTALGLLRDLSEEEKSNVGLQLLQGIATADPQKAWQWIEANQPYDIGKSFLSKQQYDVLLANTLTSMAKDPQSQWRAYKLASKSIGTGKDEVNWIKSSVARIIAKNDIDQVVDLVLTMAQEGLKDANLVDGVVFELTNTDIQGAAQFITEHQNIIPDTTAGHVTSTYISSNQLSELHELLGTINNKQLFESMVTRAAVELPEVGLDETIALFKIISDEKFRGSAAISTYVRMKDLPYSFEDHMRFFEEGIADRSERFGTYSFAATMHDWVIKEPEKVELYLADMANEDREAYSKFYRTFERLLKEDETISWNP